MNEPADRIPALRSDLIAAGLTVDALGGLWGSEAAEALHRGQRVPAERALARRDPSPLATLARLFVLSRPVSREDAAAALPALGMEGAESLGLLALGEDGTVSAVVDLRPYAFVDAAGPAEWWIVSDLGELALGHALPEDHVLGVGGASLTLSGLMLQTPVDSALDLGTGCGIQAMHAARHARRVVATDISQRALRLAALNLALNEIDGVELRFGNMFEPVSGERFERFDHIVSNPPFVITPRRPGVQTYEYRDAGLVGDAVVERLVRNVGHHLEPGGVSLFIGNWEVPRGRTWRDVWTSWLDGTGLDAWVVQRDEQDPAEYAELWAGDAGSRSGTAGYDDLYAAWLADFADRGVERIGFGVVALQRPERQREPWTDLVDHRGPVADAMGPVVDAGLAARTWLAEHDDDALLDVAWSCAPDVVEERHTRPGATDPDVIQLRQGGGLGRTHRLDTVAAGLVGVCDGTLTARRALDAIAALLELPERDVATSAVPHLRALVADGLLR
jgi:methylase of polypeptide subunit release factors